eukprot:TRINITY_DN10726_c0_g1_i1.p1 TRINITY_DN10726_c0_g1~~TRINITY_DN10726_c0_g1_i1.p1  ORF type:complete len:175 (-),score=36.52 TRINITY_DN10726_c0_g1_i1:238-762(-)
MSAYRTSHVATSFEPSMLDGFWYEHAYIDLAQVGSSCQTLNGTHSDSTGVILMDFAVKYGPIPFTIVEQYTPKNASTTRGLYTKQAKMPGGKFLTLSTVMVDVTPSSMIMYSCVAPLHAAQVDELVFATRSPEVDAATLAQMKATARGAGVVWDDKRLKSVDHSKCDSLVQPFD